MSAASQAESLLSLIYAAAVDDEVWPTLPRQLAAHIDADAVLLRHLPAATPSAVQVWTHGLDAAAVAAFMTEGVIDQSRFSSALLVLPADHLAKGRRLGADAGPVDHPGSSIVLRPPRPLDDQTAAVLRRAGTCWILACFGAPCQRPDETSRRRVLASLLPHLRRAAVLRSRLARRSDDASILAEALDLLALGVVTVGADLAVLFANDQAADALARGDGLRRSGGRLTLGDLAAQRRMKAVVARMAAGQADGESACFCVRRPSAAPPFTLVVAPVAAGKGIGDGRLAAAAATILVIDPLSQEWLPAAAHLAERFALTATEAEVARLAAMGRGMPFVADALGVSLNTVRTHLKAVYGKTDVNQQAGLARLIAESFPPLRRPTGDAPVPADRERCWQAAEKVPMAAMRQK